MSQTLRIGFVAGLATAGAAFANSTPDSQASYAAQLLADADSRTSLLQGGSAGYDGGAYITDGNNTLRTNVLLQFGYTANFRDEDEAGEDNEFTHGFSIPRARLRFSGTIGSPDLEFLVDGQWETSSSDDDSSSDYESTSFSLNRAYGIYHLDGPDGNHAIWFGQGDNPVVRQQMIDAAHLNTAERGIALEFFSPQFVQGIQYMYNDDNIRFIGGVTDGAFSGNTSFSSMMEADLAINGRIEALFSGSWDQFQDLGSWKGSADAFMVGGGVHYQTGGSTGINTADVDVILYTLDAAYEGDGWAVAASFYGVNIEDDDTDADADHFGIDVQASLFVSDQVELFARYDGLFLDDETLPMGAEDTLNFLTFGGTYYFVPQSHAAKIIVDVVWAFDGLPSGNFADSGIDSRIGLLGNGEEDEFAIRAIASINL